MISAFPGFPPSTLNFLGELRNNNERAWFEAHREDYERFYVAPAKAFVEAVGPPLREIAPSIHAEPRILGSIFRINRDIRFSKDKSPYKDHFDFWFWEGDRRVAVSGFFVRVGPDLLGIGAGSHGFDRDQLRAYRTALGNPATASRLAEIAETIKAAGYHLGGGTDLEKRSAFFVHVDAPAEVATKPRLLDECVGHWRRLAPLHRFLVDCVGAGSQ